MRFGYTLVWVGLGVRRARIGRWRCGFMCRSPPNSGKPITGVVRAAWTASAAANEFVVTDLAAVRRHRSRRAGQLAAGVCDDCSTASATPCPRRSWRVSGHTVTLDRGFEPGKTYRVSYRAANPPVAGLGFVADARHHRVAEAPAGRAGAGAVCLRLRLVAERPLSPQLPVRRLQHRRARSSGVRRRHGAHRRRGAPRPQRALVDADRPRRPRRDVVSVRGRQPARSGERRAGRACSTTRAWRGHAPKVFYTNTPVEYWGAGRVAALVHTTPDGTADLPLPENVRVYFIAGTQHSPSRFPAGRHQRPAG